MSHPDVHPGEEALAAYAAGPDDGAAASAAGPVTATDQVPPPGAAAIEAHLTECARCRDEVDQLRFAARQLALLTEPELPAGLHDRLVAAVRAEQAAGNRHRAGAATSGRSTTTSTAPSAAPAGGTVAAPADLAAARRRRAGGRSGGPFGWVAAAAVVVLLGIVGVSQLGEIVTSQSGGNADSAAQAPTAGAFDGSAREDAGGGSGAGSGDVPEASPRFSAAGEYDLDRFAADLETRPELRTAYDSALAASRRVTTESRTGGDPAPGEAGPPPVSGQTPDDGGDNQSGEPETLSGGAAKTCQPPASAGASVLLIDAVYQGLPATVAIVVRDDPPLASLYAYERGAFDRGDCALIGTESGALP